MIVLCVRTDKPEAELYLYNDGKLLASNHWHAHKQLSVTFHSKIEALLNGHKWALKDLDGIVFYEGPGSFTGLRIGASVVNALGAGLQIAVQAAGTDDWQAQGLTALKGQKQFIALAPTYGSEAFITAPKK
jgi:tRNA threonylcarbamoyladenosine biosynthesis protein TsaB